MSLTEQFQSLTGIRLDPPLNHNFLVMIVDTSSPGAFLASAAISLAGDVLFGGFSECSGLDMTMQSEKLHEGGLNNTEHRFPGRITWDNLVLKRGVSRISQSGWDWLYDFGEGKVKRKDGLIVLMDDLAYSKAQIVVAVPESWLDITAMADLADLAVEFKAAGRELRIATDYPNLARSFLYDHGVNYFTLTGAHGALEAAPAMGYADLVVEITETGTTLRENRLKLLDDGTILGIGGNALHDATYAIVGGTGRFAGATGSYTARQSPRETGGDGTAEFILTLSALEA